MSADKLAVVAGIHVIDTARIERALKHLDAASKTDTKIPAVKWNAGEHAGVSFHRVTIDVPDDDVKRYFGESVTCSIGIAKDAVYLAIGNGSMPLLAKAMDTSAQGRGKVAPAFDMVASVGPIADAVAARADQERERAIARAMVEAVRDAGPMKDRARMVGNYVPNGLQFSIELGEGPLRAVGAAAEQRQATRSEN